MFPCAIFDLNCNILLEVDDEDLINLRQVNKYICTLLNGDAFWFRRYDKYLAPELRHCPGYINKISWYFFWRKQDYPDVIANTLQLTAEQNYIRLKTIQGQLIKDSQIFQREYDLLTRAVQRNNQEYIDYISQFFEDPQGTLQRITFQTTKRNFSESWFAPDSTLKTFLELIEQDIDQAKSYFYNHSNDIRHTILHKKLTSLTAIKLCMELNVVFEIDPKHFCTIPKINLLYQTVGLSLFKDLLREYYLMSAITADNSIYNWIKVLLLNKIEVYTVINSINIGFLPYDVIAYLYLTGDEDYKECLINWIMEMYDLVSESVFDSTEELLADMYGSCHNIFRFILDCQNGKQVNYWEAMSTVKSSI